MTLEPDGPRSGFGVGISGHRPNKLTKAVVPRIEDQLREVMAAVEHALRGTGAGVRLISGFAEGADQMAVAASPPGWTVEAILPFAEEEFLKDFEQSAAGDGRDVRAEFLASLRRASAVTELPTPTDGPRERGYIAVGRAIVRESDVLIVVWDGEEAKPGGTGAVAMDAAAAGIPVVWLSTTTEREPVLIERFDRGGPVVSSENWLTGLSRAVLSRVRRGNNN